MLEKIKRFFKSEFMRNFARGVNAAHVQSFIIF